MYSLTLSDLGDTYIDDFLKRSIAQNSISVDIETIRNEMIYLRLKIYNLCNSAERKQEYRNTVERLMILFKALLIERDKRITKLTIKIPYTSEFFSNSPQTRSYSYDY